MAKAVAAWIAVILIAAIAFFAWVDVINLGKLVYRIWNH